MCGEQAQAFQGKEGFVLGPGRSTSCDAYRVYPINLHVISFCSGDVIL